MGAGRAVERLLPIASFGLSKAAVLMAPLLLAAVLPVSAYGEFEGAIALAGILAPVLTGGMSAAIPYFLLKSADHARTPQILLFASIVLGACLTGVVTTVVAAGWVFPATSLLLATALSAQVTISVFLKCHGKAAPASAVEGGLYWVMAGGALAAMGGGLLDISILYWSVAVYTAVLWALITGRVLASGGSFSAQLQGLRQVLRYAVPFVLPALGMLLVVNGGRVLSGQWLDSESTALYGFIFRIAAPAILIHQLLATIFFRQLYTSDPARLDLYFSSVIMMVTLVGTLGYLIAPPLLAGIFPLLDSVSPEELQVYQLVLAQISLWVALALLEPILARENKAWSQLSVLLLAVMAGALPAAWLAATGRLGLLALCQIQTAVFALAFTGMFVIVWRAGVRLPWSASVVGLICASISAIQVLGLDG